MSTRVTSRPVTSHLIAEGDPEGPINKSLASKVNVGSPELKAESSVRQLH